MIKSLEKYTNWLFMLKRSKKLFVQVVSDLVIVKISLYLAFFVRLENTDFIYNTDSYFGLLVVIATALLTFASLGLYKTFARFSSFDAISIVAAGSLASAGILITFIFLFDLIIPKSVPLIYGLFLFLNAGGTRFLVRALSEATYQGERKNVAIYGAEVKGIQLMNALKLNQHYRVCLFIDDNPELQNKTLSGVPVERPHLAVNKFKKFNINTLLLAAPINNKRSRERVLQILSEHPMAVKTIPSIDDIIDSKTINPEFSDVNVEDLIGREPSLPNLKLMNKNVVDKTVLVTGAGGSIGSEICRQLIELNPKKILILDVSEYSIYALLKELTATVADKDLIIIPLIGSVQDPRFLEKITKQFAIDTIYHAAAYKHVPLMEANILQCISNNVFGTLNLAEQAIRSNVKNFILVSTDKAVNPTNFMGASKRLAELVCQNRARSQTSTHFCIVRFGNVLGSSGSVVPLFKQQIEAGGPVTITSKDITRYFMTIPEAAQLVIQAGAIPNNGAVFVLDMGKPIKILDLAKKMIALSGKTYSEPKNDKGDDQSITIQVTGLRPGEKMHEELSYSKRLINTVHPKILLTDQKLDAQNDIDVLIESLEQAINSGNDHRLLNAIKSEFKNITKTDDSVDMFPETNRATPSITEH